MQKRRSTRRPPVARALLRLPADLHESLTAVAAAEGLSFNAYCLRRLSAPRTLGETSALQALVLDRARAAAGAHLAGVVVLGSWARGEAAADSDIDVLIVIDAHAPLTRDTYRDWDQALLTFEGRPIDAHVVHPSDEGVPPTGLWCEAAVDGQVWYDRDGRLTRRLSDIRRAIADGRVLRAFAHGQPYWKGAA